MKEISTPSRDFEIYIARPDTRYGTREPSDSLDAIYNNGYLPYSGATDLKNVFYSARSARILASEFGMTSENRRIAKKYEGQFVKERIDVSAFTPTEIFWNLCLKYFAHTHGEQVMPRARLETILGSGLISTIIVYTKDANPIAYVFEIEEGSMGHFWFSFFDLSYAKQSLGLWLMLDAIQDAQTRKLTHYYLGTVYGEKALYKLNFGPLEWWDGQSWNKDISLLKEKSRSD